MLTKSDIIISKNCNDNEKFIYLAN